MSQPEPPPQAPPPPPPPSPPPPPPPQDNHHQTYAVELYFDPALENQVLKAWNVLARRQITTHLISTSSRPHITILRLPLPDPFRLHSTLRSLSGRTDPVPLSLSTVGSSSAASALFLLPTPTASLLQLHAQLCEAVRREGIEVGERYRVDSWVPRCAAAEDVPRGRMGEAFCVLRDMRLPVSGYVMDVGVVEVSADDGDAPVREVFSFRLGGSSLQES